MVTHHGLDQSGSPVLVHALQPRVAVMQNGTRKGAGAEAMPTMRTSPGLEDIWQLHWSYGAGIEQNSAGVFIANVDDNATIAGILTAPPRRAVRAAAPRVQAPAARRWWSAGRRRASRRPPAGAAPAARAGRRRRAGRPAGAGRWCTTGAPERAVATRRGGAFAGLLIKISARPDGSFTVTNTATGSRRRTPRAREPR